MAVLTNPITPQNLVNRFRDFVTTTANTSIVYGTNNKPFTEMPTATYQGTTSGVTVSITGANIGSTGNTITASTIRSVLEAETALYTNIRLQRAILFVTGGGGNNGSRPTPGTVFDQTNKAHLLIANRQALGAVSNSNVLASSTVSAFNLEEYFTNLKVAYETKRNVVITTQINVCHASCHSSCHDSRSRR